jgi:hypothetical protein
MPTAVGVPTCRPSYRAPSQSAGLGRTQAHRRPVALLPPLRPANHPALGHAADRIRDTRRLVIGSPERLEFPESSSIYLTAIAIRLLATGVVFEPSVNTTTRTLLTASQVVVRAGSNCRPSVFQELCHLESTYLEKAPTAQLIRIDAADRLFSVPLTRITSVPGCAVSSVGFLWGSAAVSCSCGGSVGPAEAPDSAPADRPGSATSGG